MATTEKQLKLLQALQLLTFQFPIKNRTTRILFSTFLLLTWISGYIHLMFSNFFIWHATIVSMITQLNSFVLFLTGIGLIVTGCIHIDRLEKFWRLLTNLDEILIEKHRKETEIKRKTNNHMLLTSLTMIFLIIITLFGILLNLFDQENVISPLLLVYFIGCCLCMIAIYSTAGIYVNLVEIIRQRFEFISSEILTLKCECNPIQMRNKLNSLQLSHLNVCDIVEIVNSTYGMSLLAVIIALVMNLLISLYLVAFSLNCLGLEVLANGKSVQIFFFAPNIVIIMYLAYICDVATKDSVKCGKSIHSISTTATIADDTDSGDICQLLKAFSIQISCFEQKLTAGDFLAFDKSLIFSIIGGIFTYLIILIQFSNGNTVCDYFVSHFNEFE